MDYKPGDQEYAKWRAGYNGHNGNITAWVIILEVNEETVTFQDDFKKNN